MTLSITDDAVTNMYCIRVVTASSKTHPLDFLQSVHVLHCHPYCCYSSFSFPPFFYWWSAMLCWRYSSKLHTSLWPRTLKVVLSAHMYFYIFSSGEPKNINSVSSLIYGITTGVVDNFAYQNSDRSNPTMWIYIQYLSQYQILRQNQHLHFHLSYCMSHSASSHRSFHIHLYFYLLSHFVKIHVWMKIW